MKNLMRVSIMAATLTFAGAFAFAQDPGGDGPGGFGGPPGDASEMQQRMQEMQGRILDRYKEQLKCTDEEWTAIKPLLTKVQELERSSGTTGRGMMGMMGGMRPGGQGGPPQGMQGMPGMPGADGKDATSQLRKTLADDKATADEIKEKVKAVREERAKNAAALKAAREELRKLLTARQEAVLITVGLLD